MPCGTGQAGERCRCRRERGTRSGLRAEGCTSSLSLRAVDGGAVKRWPAKRGLAPGRGGKLTWSKTFTKSQMSEAQADSSQNYPKAQNYPAKSKAIVSMVQKHKRLKMHFPPRRLLHVQPCRRGRGGATCRREKGTASRQLSPYQLRK